MPLERDIARDCSPFLDRLIERHPRWFEQLQADDRLLRDCPPTRTVLDQEIEDNGLDAGLRRFANSVTRTVAIGTPNADQKLHFTAVLNSPYEVGYVELDIEGMGGEANCVDGQQFIEASAPVGILVGGYDCAASYAYPGGLALSSLWNPPSEPPD